MFKSDSRFVVVLVYYNIKLLRVPLRVDLFLRKQTSLFFKSQNLAYFEPHKTFG